MEKLTDQLNEIETRVICVTNEVLREQLEEQALEIKATLSKMKENADYERKLMYARLKFKSTNDVFTWIELNNGSFDMSVLIKKMRLRVTPKLSLKNLVDIANAFQKSIVIKNLYGCAIYIIRECYSSSWSVYVDTIEDMDDVDEILELKMMMKNEDDVAWTN